MQQNTTHRVSTIPQGIKQISPDVFVLKEKTYVVDRRIIEWLKSKALASPTRRARICLHETSDEIVQEMIIAVHKTSFVPPHYHPYKEETFNVMEGKASMLIFSADGKITEKYELSALTSLEQKSADSYFYRVKRNTIHGLVLKTEWLIFHEVTSGPYRSDGIKIPDWAPKDKNIDEHCSWYINLLKNDENFKNG